MSTCIICKRERQDCVEHELTESERSVIEHHTQEEAPAKYIYCRACFRIVSNREQGARLMQGILFSQLQAKGHPKAQEIADKLYKTMIEGSTKAPVS